MGNTLNEPDSCFQKSHFISIQLHLIDDQVQFESV